MSAQQFFADFKEKKKSKTHFSNKAAIDSLDLTDFYKRELCREIKALIPQDKSEDEVARIGKMTGCIELRAIIHFRTERLTLERLAEVYEALSGTESLVQNLRKNFVETIVSDKKFKNLQLNAEIRANLELGGSELLYLDFLVGLIEKLSIMTGRKTISMPGLPLPVRKTG